jgi:hypothetical protein
MYGVTILKWSVRQYCGTERIGFVLLGGETSASLQWRIDTLNPYRYWVVSDIAHRCIDNGRHLSLFPPGGLQSPFGRDRDAHRAPPVGSSQTAADGEGELSGAGHVGAVQTAGWPRYGLQHSTCMLTLYLVGAERKNFAFLGFWAWPARRRQESADKPWLEVEGRWIWMCSGEISTHPLSRLFLI